MTSYHASIATVLDAVDVEPPGSYRWFGIRSPSLAPEIEAAMDPQSLRGYLVHNLKWQLYADFYCPGAARPTLQEPVADSMTGDSAFVHALSIANTGSGSREPGWMLDRIDDGSFVVTRDGLTLWLAPGEVYPTSGATPTPGSPVGVMMPKELLRLSPGFYMALGNAEFPADGSIPMVRFYWNLRSEAAASLIAALTGGLNQGDLPFRLKVVGEPARYSRCDAGVLYGRQSDFDRIAVVVRDTYKAMRAGLKPTTPSLTKPLAPGLALAEDPGTGLASFGMSRCELLADGIVRAAELGLRRPGERVEAVEARFAEAGVALEFPYLNPGSHDEYWVDSL